MVLIVWVHAAGVASAQPGGTIDSLKSLLPSADKKSKYDLFIQLVYEAAKSNNQEALEYAIMANGIAAEFGDSLEICTSGRLRGQILRRVARLDEAITQLTEVLGIAQRNGFVDEEKSILNALAISHNYRAEYDKALEYHFRSLEIREQEGDQTEISTSLNNIGLVYYKMSDFDHALDFYQRAVTFAEKSASKADMGTLLVNIALCQTKLGRLSEARESVYRAYEACSSSCSDKLLMEGEYALGYSLYGLEDFEKAKGHFAKSLVLSRKNDDKRFQIENLLYLARMDAQLTQYDSAIRMLHEAEVLSKAARYNQLLINTYQQLYGVYHQTNDTEKASEYQLRYIQLKDSVYSETLIQNLAEVQSKYAERENIKTIAAQDEILHLNQIVIDRQRQVYFFVGLVAVLSIMITFVFLRYSRALSVAKAQLSVMNQTLERRVEDRTKALQNVNNELDNFIYKTSHDIRGPLASLKGIANVALLELTDTKAQDYLHKLDASADKLNTILTRLLIVNQINHAVLTPVKIEFPELIQEILTFERKKGIPPRLTIRHEIDPDTELVTDRHILRIILENLIDNAIKYHNSSDRVEPFVKIKVASRLEGVKIHVIDNGIGIKEHDPQKLFQMFVRASERSESGGIGLYLTKLASERLFAKVDFSTTPEKFTQFIVTLPVDLRTIVVEKEKEVV